jgi:hypothetical protein
VLLTGVEGSAGNRFVGSAVGNAFFGTTSAHGLELGTNNNVRMVIDSSGNVGIGLTNPAAYGKLVVSGTGNIFNVIASSGASRIGLFEGGTGRFYIDTLNGSDGIAFVDGNGTSERMRIDADGNVGIGSDSPNTPLEVKSSGIGESTGIRLTDTNGTTRGNIYFGGAQNLIIHGASAPLGADAPALQFATGGSTPAVRMTVLEEGNVGIGIDSPTSKFHVDSAPNGNIPVTYILQSGATNAPTLRIAQTGDGGNPNVTQGLLIEVAGTNDGTSNLIRAVGKNSNVNSGVDVEAFVVQNGGNVGIGTASPAVPLHVYNATQGRVAIENASRRFDLSVDADGLGFRDQTAAVTRMILTSAGALQLSDVNSPNDINTAIFSNSDVLELEAFGTNGAIAFSTGSGVDERMRIDVSGNVGIGVTPEAWTAFNPVLRIKNAATGGGGALAGSGVDNFRMFANTYYDGDYKRLDVGFATQYGQESGAHVWSTAATGNGNSTITWSESMRIDTSGNLLVGTGDASIETSSSNEGVVIKNDRVSASRTSGTSANFNRISDNGDIVNFRFNGQVIGSIGVTTGPAAYMVFNDAITDNVAALKGASSAILPSTNAGVDKDGTMNLGSNDARFNNLHLSGGVVFGTTGGDVTSKTLDDYEEGNWTPTINSGTMTATDAKYTKIGRSVQVSANIADISDNTSAVDIIIGGLPFTSTSDNRGVGSVMFRYFTKTNAMQMTAYIGASRNTLDFYWSFNSNSAWTPVQFDDGSQANMDIIFTATYIV